MPANCAEISKVTSGGGNWILRDLGPPEAKVFDRNRARGATLKVGGGGGGGAE